MSGKSQGILKWMISGNPICIPVQRFRICSAVLCFIRAEGLLRDNTSHIWVKHILSPLLEPSQ